MKTYTFTRLSDASAFRSRVVRLGYTASSVWCEDRTYYVTCNY